MKKLLIFIFIFLFSSSVLAGQITMAPMIIQSSDCTFLTWYGTLCHDTDDGKLYKWNGAALEEVQSGIALDTIWDAAGDLIQGTGANTAAKLSAGAAGKVLRSAGTGVAVGWSDYTIATPTTGGLLYGSSASAWANLAAGTEGQVLRAGASPFLPAWTSTLTGVSVDFGSPAAANYPVTMDANGVGQVGTDVVVPGQLSATTYASDGSVSDAELKFISTLSSNAQDQIGAKANIASPTFTGTLTSPTVSVSGATGVSPFSTTGSQFRTVASTITDSFTPGTRAVGVANSIGLPTFASDGNSITITDAVNLYVAGVPIDGGANMELTRTWGFYQAAGNQYLAGSLLIADAPAVPGARLQLPAGTTTALTAPLKLTSGTSMTTPEAGAFEFTTDTLSFTITTGPTRKTIAFLESPSFTTPALGVATATSLTIANVTNDNYLQITDNAGGRAPTGSAWELYPDAGVWKMNTNGTESTIAKLEAPTFVTSVGLPATLTSAAALTWTLMDNQASGLSFGATGAADILKIGTLDTGAIVTVTGNLAITGDGTFTGGDIILGANTTTAGSALFYGGTSGSITLSPVAVAGTTTLTIPAITGRVQIASAGSVITPSATASLAVGLSNFYTWTVTDDEDSTLTFDGAGSAGEEVTIIFTTAGTADEIITFEATLVSSTGTLTLGTTAGKFYTIRFISDGAHWYEVSRTAVQT